MAKPEPIRVPDEASGREQRRHIRKHVLWTARLETTGGALDCIILNISRSGAKLRLTAPDLLLQPVKLVMESYGTLPAENVWQQVDNVGLRFNADPEAVAKILGDALKL
jgi:hypothetical protein